MHLPRLSLQSRQDQAFTLIELSIVIVIIGLVVGGVLAGRDLIAAAAVRSQIAQIEKYHTATNTFRVKYNYQPGDIPNPDAANFGFVTRGQYGGEGDGNGLVEGISASGGGHNWGAYQSGGETAMFWVDLSTAKLIPEQFNTASPSAPVGSTVTATSTPSLDRYLPKAAIGQDNRIEIWSYSTLPYTAVGVPNTNYFGLVGITSIAATGASSVVGTTKLTVQQAYSIDSKIDDGNPQTGRVTAAWGQYSAVPFVGAATTAATPGSSTTCYDNNNVNWIPHGYSLSQNNGTGMNCALSFRLQ